MSSPQHCDRRTVLTTVAWSVPAVVVSSSAPAFATSPTAAPLSLESSPRGNGAWDLSVENPRSEPVSVALVFTPTPDEATAGSLQAYSGFSELSVAPAAQSYTLTGTLAAGATTSGWCWWREGDGSSTPTVELLVDGDSHDRISLSV